jgi:hypothetical protein
MGRCRAQNAPWAGLPPEEWLYTAGPDFYTTTKFPLAPGQSPGRQNRPGKPHIPGTYTKAVRHFADKSRLAKGAGTGSGLWAKPLRLLCFSKAEGAYPGRSGPVAGSLAARYIMPDACYPVADTNTLTLFILIILNSQV